MDEWKLFRILCKTCFSEFSLFDQQNFIDHMLTKCSPDSKHYLLKDKLLKKAYPCAHCSFMCYSADDFLTHFQNIHQIKLLKPETSDEAIQIEEYEELNLNFENSVYEYISLKPEENLEVDGNNDLNNDATGANVIKRRTRCCLEEPGTGLCDQNTACPLLMESCMTNEPAPNCSSSSLPVKLTDSLETTSSMNIPEMVLSVSEYSDNSNKSTKKLYVCPYCTRQFQQKVHLHKHQMTKHDNIRPYQCPYENCEYSTVEKAHLRAHVRTHTGERPFVCPVCTNYRATQNCALASHMKRMHPLYRLKCPIESCGQQFVTAHTLKRHEKICNRKHNNK